MHICDVKNPCLNNGKCNKVDHQSHSSTEEYDNSNDYTCTCNSEHSGVNCEKGIKEFYHKLYNIYLT